MSAGASEDPFAFWARDLEQLSEQEQREADHLVDLIRRGKRVTANTYGSALMMRYNFTRWELIMKEVGRQLKGTG